MFVLEVTLVFSDKSTAKRFFASIKPELSQSFSRSTLTIAQKEATLKVSISAADATALRASLNGLRKPLVLFTQLEAL